MTWKSDHGSQHLDPQSNRSDPKSDHWNNLKGRVPPKPKNIWIKRNTKFGQNIIHSLHLQRRISPLSLLESLISNNRRLLSMTSNRITQTQFFYREVDISALPSRDVETFRHILDLPDPRKLCPFLYHCAGLGQ